MENQYSIPIMVSGVPLGSKGARAPHLEQKKIRRKGIKWDRKGRKREEKRGEKGENC